MARSMTSCRTVPLERMREREASCDQLTAERSSERLNLYFLTSKSCLRVRSSTYRVLRLTDRLRGSSSYEDCEYLEQNPSLFR